MNSPGKAQNTPYRTYPINNTTKPSGIAVIVAVRSFESGHIANTPGAFYKASYGRSIGRGVMIVLCASTT